jgi:hypothetical protein
LVRGRGSRPNHVTGVFMMQQVPFSDSKAIAFFRAYEYETAMY